MDIKENFAKNLIYYRKHANLTVETTFLKTKKIVTYILKKQ